MSLLTPSAFSQTVVTAKNKNEAVVSFSARSFYT